MMQVKTRLLEIISSILIGKQDNRTNKRMLQGYGAPFDKFSIENWEEHIAKLSDIQRADIITIIVVRDLLKGNSIKQAISEEIIKVLQLQDKYDALLKPMSHVSKKYMTGRDFKRTWNAKRVRDDLLKTPIEEVYMTDTVKHFLGKSISGVASLMFSFDYVTTKDEKTYLNMVVRFIKELSQKVDKALQSDSSTISNNTSKQSSTELTEVAKTDPTAFIKQSDLYALKQSTVAKTDPIVKQSSAVTKTGPAAFIRQSDLNNYTIKK